MFNPCCCDTPPSSCSIYNDTFATDLLSTKWIQVDGSWSVSGGFLVPSATDDLIVTVDDDPSTTNTYGHFVTLPVYYGVSPVVARLIVDYVDVDNYHFATAECGLTSTTVKVGKRVAGTETILNTHTATHTTTGAGAWRVFSCCFTGDGHIRSSITLQIFPTAYVSVSSFGETWLNGKKAGIKVDVYGSDLTFDQFTFKHLDRGVLEVCAGCNEECNGYCSDAFFPPSTVVVDLGVTGITDGGCNCDGVTGAFVCDTVASCGNWRYLSASFGDCSDNNCDASGALKLKIDVQNEIDGTGQRRFKIIVRLYTGVAHNPACPDFDGALYAYYYTPWTTDLDHCTLPDPLTATRSYHNNNTSGRCVGTLPATITLSA